MNGIKYMEERVRSLKIEEFISLFLPLLIYSFLIILNVLGILSLKLFYLQFFTVAYGFISIYTIRETKFEKYKVELNNLNYLIFIPITLVFFLRILPYLNYNVPLGYDPGIYKYEIERYWRGLPNVMPPDLESWDRRWSPPGLFILTTVLHLYGFDSFYQYIYLFIFFDIMLVVGLYVSGKKFFGQKAGLIAAFFCSISYVQFGAFYYFYFKNIVALFLVLISSYFFKSGKYVPLILVGAVLGSIHRPTFLIFALVYLSLLARQLFSSGRIFLVFIRNFSIGLLILALAFVFYIPTHLSALNYLEWFLNPNLDIIAPNTGTNPPLLEQEGGMTFEKSIGSGTFISISDYYLVSMFYLPLAFSGLLFAMRNRNFNFFILWGIITFLIVYSKLFFFKRFILHLDIALVLLAGFGFYYLIRYNKFFGVLILVLLASSAFYVTYQVTAHTEPLIDEEELSYISELQKVNEDAYVMTIHNFYSPWVVGYSGKKTIAPGLFEYDKWNYTQWKKFWSNSDPEVTSEMLKEYDKPIYIYIGKKIHLKNESTYSGVCFNKYLEENGVIIYRFNYSD